MRSRAPASEAGVDTKFHHLPWLPSGDSNTISRRNKPLSYPLDDRGSDIGTSRNRTDRTVLAKHRRRALVHAVPWNPRTESNRRVTGFVIRCLSAWLRGHDTASSTGRRPPRHPILAPVAPRRRLRVARLAVNARLCLIPFDWPERRRSNPRPGFFGPVLFLLSYSPTICRLHFTWRSGRESNTLVALATRRRSRSMPYRSATTPNAISSRPFSRRKTRRCPDRGSA